MLDAELYEKTGRVRTPSLPALSDDEVEVIEVGGDSAGVVAKSRSSGSTCICRCEGGKAGPVRAQTEEKTEDVRRDPHLVQCIGEDEDDDVRGPEERLKSEPSASSSEESLQGTDTKFVPSEEELESTSNNTSSCEADDVSVEDTQNSEEEVSEDIEEEANQVHTRYNFFCPQWFITCNCNLQVLQICKVRVLTCLQ